MDFAWTPEQEAYRTRLRAFLDTNLPSDWDEKSNHDPGSEYVIGFAREFCPKLAAAGYLVPHWPVEYGGSGADPWHSWILGGEFNARGEPRSYQYLNVNLVGPAILDFGTPAQKAHHLPLIAGGKVFWCQGFSEPEAGSDLAALSTRAEKIPGGYRISGHKIWVAAATFADYCFLLARTSDDRHAITTFLLPMNTPGITVNALNSLTGTNAMNEMLLDGVEVGDDCVLGTPGDGWSVVKSALQNERVGAPVFTAGLKALDHAVAALRRDGRDRRADVQVRLARVRATLTVADLLASQVVDGRAKGRPAGPGTNAARYAAGRAMHMVADFLGEFCGDQLLANEDQVISKVYRRAASSALGGGAAEIQLNLVARNLLNLPKG